MRKRLLSAAVASIGMGRSYGSYGTYQSFGWHGDPCVPVSPTVSKERKCAQCKVGIVTGRHCFKCENSKRK